MTAKRRAARGQAAVEYVLLVGVMAAAFFAARAVFRPVWRAHFERIARVVALPVP